MVRFEFLAYVVVARDILSLKHFVFAATQAVVAYLKGVGMLITIQDWQIQH